MHSQKTNVARWRAALTCDNARKGPFVSILAKPLSYSSIDTSTALDRAVEGLVGEFGDDGSGGGSSSSLLPLGDDLIATT